MQLITRFPINTTMDFMRYRAWSYPASLLGIVISLLAFAIVGVNTGIDFSSGVRFTIKLNEGANDLAAIRAEVEELGLGDFQLQQFEGPDSILLGLEEQPGGDDAQNAAIKKVTDKLGPRIKESSYESIGPSVSEILVRGGILAVVSANLLVLFYLWMRFEWPFAVGAVVALLHDVIFTLGMYTFTRLEFNLSSVAAILTIIGYSLNDTVVVFDRIRETLQKTKRLGMPEIINRAVNDTLPRTFMTSVTTLLALLALYFFGPEVVKSFTVAMIVGVVIGTYSSVFIAAPMLIFIDLKSLAIDENGNPIQR